MNIDQLKYFADLAKTNSITTTAKRMFISQQALSESIKRLENEVGCTLVTRSKTGVSFTEDGKLILDYAKKILELHMALEEELQSKYNKDFLHGKLTIGVGPTVSNVFLPKLMLKMHRQYPSIKLHVLESPRESILSLLRTSELDFGIFGIYTETDSERFVGPEEKLLTSLQTFEKLHLTKLYTDPMVCVMYKNHPMTAQKVLTREQLKDIAQTNYATDATSFTVSNAVHVSTNARIHQQFMQEEGLICCMPYQAYLTQFQDKNFVFRPISDYPPVENYLIYRENLLEENEALYTRFIETAQLLAAEL